jgi:thiol-disulfide isomerase/thioredoxin
MERRQHQHVRSALLTMCLIGLAACSTRTVYVAKEPQGASAQDQVARGWVLVRGGRTVEAIPGRPLDDRVQPDLSGVVLVNVWASACAPCRREMPLLEEAGKTGVVHVIGVSRDRYAEFARDTISKRGVTYPNMLDTKGRFAVALDGAIPFAAIPSSVLMLDGRVVATHTGELTSMQEIRTGADLVGQ